MFIVGMLLGIGLGIIVMACMSIGTINDYINQNEKLLKDYSNVFEKNVDLKTKIRKIMIVSMKYASMNIVTVKKKELYYLL